MSGAGAAYQATAVAIDGRALLIEGAPGSGKSSLALALIDRGAQLIGDDSVMLECMGDRVRVCPHPNTRGLLEVRNLGLVAMPVVDGAPVGLVVRLDETAPRFIEQAETAVLAGMAVPLVRLWPGSPVLHLRAELALERFGLAT